MSGNSNSFSLNSGFVLVVSVFVLILVIGFPRVYGTELPMAVFLVPFFARGFFRFMLVRGWFSLGLIGLFGLWFIGGLLAYLNGKGGIPDLFFHLVISVKIVLSFFFGYVVFQVVKGRPLALLLWIIFQVIVIICSVANYDFYSMLLGFISPRSADVFQYVFGLRAVGFGLFHVDGALLLVTSVFYYILVSGYSFSKSLLLILMLPVSMAVARSAIIPYMIFVMLKRGFLLKMALIISFVLMFCVSLFVTGGPLYEATEIFRNFLERGELQSDSVGALAEMYALPASDYTYLFGDGRFFSDNSQSLKFYMETDIGYMRLLYFSGAGSVFVFILLNVYPVFGLLFWRFFRGGIDIKMFALSLMLIFLVINFKGLQSMPVFSMALYLYAIDRKAGGRRMGWRDLGGPRRAARSAVQCSGIIDKFS